jgi:hypothetical protein
MFDMRDAAKFFPVLRQVAATPESNALSANIVHPAMAAEEVDEQGDAIFRFRIKPLENANQVELREVFRQTILDILQLVKFYSDGKPLIIDSFAFLNEPTNQIRLVARDPKC